MFTFKKLRQAYDNAKIIPFNDASRFVIMSDMHRGDNSFSDEFAPNQNIFLHAANHYYENGFELIENGDGDELWEHSKFEYIYYAHQDVFSVYQKFHEKGRLHIIYGNHNIQLKYPQIVERTFDKAHDPYTDQWIEFMPGIQVHESVRLRYEDFGKDIFIVHGHQGDAMNDTFWRFAHFMMRFVWKYLHIIGFRNPASPAKSIIKRHKIERKYRRWIERTDQFMVVGHTHRPKFSQPNELPYFNAGSAVRPRVITAIEIVGGTISLVEWRIWPNTKGLLQVDRRVLDGPIAVSKYMYTQR